LVAAHGDVTIDQILGISPTAEDPSQNLLTGRERNSFVRLARLKTGIGDSSSQDVLDLLHSIRGYRAPSDTQLFHLSVDGDGSYIVENYKARLKG